MTYSKPESHNRTLPPLAERIRPRSLADFIGQKEIAGPDSLLIRSLKQQNLFSFIFWGPPGSGKTTLAKLIARETDAAFFELSAISSGVADVRKILNHGRDALKMEQRTVLFIDEIHRFNKAQQDALLNAVETGAVILIGATTENPSFEVISPLLSRCRVLKLQRHNENELNQIIDRALTSDQVLKPRDITLPTQVLNLLTGSSGGDARRLLNTLELAISFHPETQSPVILTLDDIHRATQQKSMVYDKAGDYHYDTISAFIKSVRGSDPDAALYWLAVMLEGGEKPEFIARRLIILASEDVGNADPYAVMLASASLQAVHAVGMPEGRIILGQVTCYLAGAPKSNAAYLGIKAAQEYVQKNGAASVPLHLRNAPTKLMKDLNYGKRYRYAHDFPEHFIKEHYFPEQITRPPAFYKPTDIGREKTLRDRLIRLWKDRFKS